MRHWRGLALALIAAVLAGCTSSKTTHSTAWLDRFRRGAAPTGADVVSIDVALLERPAADRFLNEEVWVTADEQVVALERKAPLEDNGFRVGQVGGLTPVKLQELLTNKRSNPSPRHRELHAGKPVALDLGPPIPVCRFELLRSGEPVKVALEQAQCSLEVTPLLASDGRIKLSFVPQVLHGEASLMPKPAPDGSGWILPQTRPTERYPQMGWEVTIAPNEYIIVGTRYCQEQTLGHQSFVRTDDGAAIQRLLVIRTGRQAPPVDEPVVNDDGSTLWTPPLASQVSLSAVRGTAP